jgi:ubiquinone/menaquinone biosynthesis C-methylase UbiE
MPCQATNNHHRGHAGRPVTQVRWLDLHHTVFQSEYTEMLHRVGFRPGYHILDAGCGGGNCIPWLAELVGPDGRLTAMDEDEDEVTTVKAKIVLSRLVCPVRAQVGSLLRLPFPDDSFDAAWCADMARKLNDDELGAAVGELCRVVRPGGLVALADMDPGLQRLSPADPLIVLRLWAAARSTSLRPRELRRWLDRAGLVAVRQ